MKMISVIVPMYNAEIFIGQCIQSVLEQTYQNWEIILVDDGSTDRGPEICERMCKSDDRIRLYRQQNSGVSRARNYGLSVARGEYVFFLDSDDAIHPLLLEEMLFYAEEKHAGLVFCDYGRFSTNKLKSVLGRSSVDDERPRWETAEGSKTQEWFHGKYIYQMSGIGGKLIASDFIKGLRFDESLINGEDTYFLYQLICDGIRVAYASCKWYYYRIHPNSATHSMAIIQGKRYYECYRRIRDREYERGYLQFALPWEILFVQQIEKSYVVRRKSRDKKGCKSIRKKAAYEREHPMFQYLYFSNRFLFYCCFYCYPFYIPLRRLASILLKCKERRR